MPWPDRVCVSALLSALTALIVSCLEPESRHCDNQQICPSGLQCSDSHGCIRAEQETACFERADETVCSFAGTEFGLCDDGVCLASRCGDSLVQFNEACDDGNTRSGDGCRSDCRKVELCGDGLLDEGESCDDQNLNPSDGCDVCRLSRWQADAQVSTFDFSESLAVDSAGTVYYAERHSHSVFSISPAGTRTRIAGNGTPGGSGDGSSALSAQLDSPRGLAIDATGSTIFIADTGNNRIRWIDTATGVIETLSGTGEDGFCCDSPGAEIQYRGPTGLYFDESGNALYVADTGNHIVRVLDVSQGLAADQVTVTTVAGTPEVLGFFGDGLEATSALLFEPKAITRCANGDIFIADTANHRIRRIDAASQVISSVLGDGVAASSGQGSPAKNYPIEAPLGLSCDSNGNVLASSANTVRLVAANDSEVVDGEGTVLSIFGVPPLEAVELAANCLSAVLFVDDATALVANSRRDPSECELAEQCNGADSCSGMLMTLERSTDMP